jgi:D-alanyl-D-alanine dipeptidase
MENKAEIQNTNLQEPIPELRKSAGWKEVPIEECGEKLVEIGVNSDRIVAASQYFEQGIPNSSPLMFVREGVAKRLDYAASLLPKGFKFVIWDSWRPLEVQQSLYDMYQDRLRASNPDMNQEQLTGLTQTYVSLPSKNPSRPSPHYTGGAVDLSIIDASGNLLNMGTVFDHFGVEASTNYYEHLSERSELEIEIANNRRLLYNAMVSAGFSAYDEEWWHFDYGNQFDAVRTGKPHAIYGPADINPEKLQ